LDFHHRSALTEQNEGFDQKHTCEGRLDRRMKFLPARSNKNSELPKRRSQSDAVVSWANTPVLIPRTVHFLQAPERSILPRDVRYAVAEIHKSHFPIRVFTIKYREGRPVFQNPFPGCYIVLDRSRAVLTSTGRPSEWDEQKRTASTILVQLAHNPTAMRIQDIASDAFCLTQLNWSAPEIEINAPVTIRWADNLLRDLYIEPER
jgi:hypothetical protein